MSIAPADRMNVNEIMKTAPRTCTPDTTVAEAAHLMWDADCGVLPVVDEGELVGVVTDRDMYIALATQNERAAVLRVGAIATATVITCHATDDVRTALEAMRRARVRRLPVVDDRKALVGILSITDIILSLGPDATLPTDEVVETLKVIGAHPYPGTLGEALSAEPVKRGHPARRRRRATPMNTPRRRVEAASPHGEGAEEGIMTTQTRAALTSGALTMMLAWTLASPAVAQVQPQSDLGTSYLSIFAGAGGMSTYMAPATGGNLGVKLTRRLNFEGRGRWFNVAAGDDAFAADVGIRYTVIRTTSTAPYVSGGVGVFESHFSHVSDTTPSFYRRRMDGADGPHNFRDMLWTVGGGADLFVTGHVALRPEISLLITSTTHDARVVPTYGISLAYFFDSQTSLSRQH